MTPEMTDDVPLLQPTPEPVPELAPANVRTWLRHQLWDYFANGMAGLMEMYMAGRPLPLVLAVKAVHDNTGVTTTVSFALTDVLSTDDMMDDGTLNHIGLYVPISKLRPAPKPAISRTVHFVGFPSTAATGGPQWWRNPIGPYTKPLTHRRRRKK
jgi:hypothetical protein